jgi:hypothetical protein
LLCAYCSVNKLSAVEMDGVSEKVVVPSALVRRRLFLRAALLVCCFINFAVYIRARIVDMCLAGVHIRRINYSQQPQQWSMCVCKHT